MAVASPGAFNRKEQTTANFLLPLSGDVTQAINQWTWLTKVVGGQFGLININLGKSSDPALGARRT